MIPDICVQVGSNFDKNAIGNTGTSGGIPSGIVDGDGPDYSGVLSSGRCVGKPVLSTMAQAPVSFSITFTDSTGNVVDMTEADEVVFIARESTYTDYKYLEKACLFVGGKEEGTVQLLLTKDDLYVAGLFEASFQLLNDVSDVLGEYRVYLELTKGMHYELSSRVDPITIAEVRMAMYDRCPEDNEFLDDVEFTDTEIIYAIRRVVDMWNESKPVIAGSIYSPSTFPYRYYGVNAVCGELYKTKGVQLARNKMAVSTGSGTIDDKERANVYLQLGAEAKQEYVEWMLGEKVRINAENVYGGTGRPAAALSANMRGL